jgi:hypothetical protein
VAWLLREPAPRELYLLTDLQRSTCRGAELPPRGAGIEVHLVDLGRDRADDWSVLEVRIEEDRVFRRVPFRLSARITAGSEGGREVVLDIEGAAERRRELNLRRGEEVEVTFEVALSGSGPATGEVRLEGRDAWPENDRRAFAVEVGSAPAVLCVRGEAGEGRLAGEILARVLAPFPGGERELARVETAAPPLPAREALERFDCVVLASPSGLSESEYLALARFAEDGGGLLAFADAGMAGGDFRARAGELFGPHGAAVRTPARPARLSRLDYGHPVLRGFAGGANGQIESVEFRSFIELRRTSREPGTLAFFSGTEPPAPAIVSSTRGRGRLIFFAAGPTREWGALYREPAFVPLVHEAVAYLARAEAALRVFTVGDRATVRLHPSERGGAAVLEAVRPEAGGPAPLRRRLEVDSERLAVDLGRLGRRGVFRLTTRSPALLRQPTPPKQPLRLRRPGGYGGPASSVAPRERRRTPAGKRARAFAVELDPRESDARRLDPSDLVGGSTSTAGPARSAGELARRIARSRGGAEVAPYLLWAALVLFALEMLVSWRLTRRRSAAAGREANMRGAI